MATSTTGILRLGSSPSCIRPVCSIPPRLRRCLDSPAAAMKHSTLPPRPVALGTSHTRRRGRPLVCASPLLAMTALLTLASSALPLASAATATPPTAPKAWGSTPKQAPKRSSPTVTLDTQSQEVSSADARIYDYVKACNPDLPPVPPLSHRPQLHQTGPTRVIPFDLGRELGVSYPATSPNLLASFIRIHKGEALTTHATATSQAFYVIRGSGTSVSKEHGTVHFKEGDLFVLPHTKEGVTHTALSDDVALYWVNDQPLLKYLGVVPNELKFQPTVFRREDMVKYVEELRHDDGAAHKNRLGILLGNKVTEGNTKTLTHTLWSLLNLLPAHTAQPPHRHNSVALDLCVSAGSNSEGKVYTLMGPELDEDGWVKDPIRLDWKAGGTFVTPPGWWHSHHNEGDEDAWVLPLQDAGLYTHMRSLDIRFSKATKETEDKAERRIE